MTTLYTDTFDATASGSLPANWASFSGNWQVSTSPPASGHTKSFTDTALGDGDISLLTGIAAVADMEAVYSFVVPATATSTKLPNVGVVLRANAGFTSGYMAILNGGLTSPGIALFTRVGTGYTQIGLASTGLNFAIGDKINVRAQVVGTGIRIKVWKNGTTEPSTWQLAVTNSAVTAPGYTGLYYAINSITGAIIGATDFSLSDAANAPPNVSPNDAGIHYSAGNWDVTSVRALSINAGAKITTLFSGVSCSLNFDQSTLISPISEVSYRIDGYGPWTTGPVSSVIACSMPADTAAYPKHLLEVIVKSTTETQDRWNGAATAVKFTGLTLASGGACFLPDTPEFVDMIFGDSITEAVRSVNSTATNDTDRNDANQGWAAELGKLLGSEVSVIGFGRQGWSVTGNGNVPILGSSASFIWNGVARTFPSNLRSVIVNMGTNDGSTNTTTAVTGFLNWLLGVIPSATKIIVLRPFNGTAQSAFLQAGIAACSAPSRVVYLDTTGVFDNTNSSDGTHPYGSENIGHIAPKLAAMIRPNFGPRRFTVNLS